MSPPGLICTLDDIAVQRRLKRALAALDDLTPAMEVIGEIATASIQQNFEAGGRPQKWEDLAEATKVHRKKTGKWPGEILVRSGELKRINYEAGKDRVIISPGNVAYAAIHQFGGMAGRGRKVEIPARPYLLFQDEDVVEYRAVLVDHLFGDLGGLA